MSFFEEFLGPIALLMDCPFLLCKPFCKNEIAIFFIVLFVLFISELIVIILQCVCYMCVFYYYQNFHICIECVIIVHL